MTATIESERRTGLLVVRLRGAIGFDEPDWRLGDELVTLLKGHVDTGGTRLLADLSEASFTYPSSFELVAGPLVRKDVVGASRVAVVLGTNERTRTRFRLTRLGGLLDCFETEAEALAFLESGAPMAGGRRSSTSSGPSRDREAAPNGGRKHRP